MNNHFLAAIFLCLAIYVFGLLAFFNVGGHKNTMALYPVENASAAIGAVLGVQDVTPTPQVGIPQSYKIVLIPRRQMFNLSCEFAAAASIIYHYTADPAFSVSNAPSSEKTLMQKVGVSDNPNLGIRMGESAPQSSDELYANLNKKFGGENYYGIHAPPFIDVFNSYGLAAHPIQKDENSIASIEKAVASGHLVMTWLQIGYGKPVDVNFTYGSVPIIKGEHSVVIHGYDRSGVFIMDPGNGVSKHVDYKDLFTSTAFFSMPFLEVYLSTDTHPSLEDTLSLGKSTGLPRENLNILVQNGTKKVGKGDQAAGILRDFGYHVVDIQNAAATDYDGVTISIKPSLKDYMYVLKKDLTVANYSIASISSTLSASSSADAVIIVGE